MRKSELYLPECIGRQLFTVIVLIVFSSCRQNSIKQVTVVKKDTIKPPVTVSGKRPTLVLLDTCPPPRKVIIPTKPGGFSLRKSDVGMKNIQSMPPIINKAGLFAPMQHFNTEHGLAVGGVNCIKEDKYGNLWFGTTAGVCRYDGKSFTNFNVSHGLANNYVIAICVDKAGTIWFGADQGGITSYDGKVFKIYNTSSGLVGNLINNIIEDKNGNIWIATGQGVSRFDPRIKSFTNFTIANGLPDNRVLSLVEDDKGNIWFGHAGGLSRLNHSDSSITVYPSMNGKVINYMIKDRNGNIFLGCYDGLSYITKDELSISPDKIHLNRLSNEKDFLSSTIYGINEDSHGRIWLATSGGVTRLDENPAIVKKNAVSLANFTTDQGLGSNFSIVTYEDSKGNVWIGGGGGGVSKLDQGGRIITTYTAKQGLPSEAVFNITEDKKHNKWFGTMAGLSVLDSSETFFTNFTTAQGLVDYFTFCVIEDRNKNIWFCTQGDGVSVMDSNHKTITTYSMKQGLPSNLVFFILEDSNGNIWLGTENGLSRFDGRSFTNYTTEEGLADNRVNNLIEAKDGNLWIATEQGISRLNLQGSSRPGESVGITSYTPEQGLSFNSVRMIIEDANGILWIGTNGKGCDRYDGKTFLNFSEADGLPDGAVFDIVQDKTGNIWLGTNKGVTRLKGFMKKDKGDKSQLLNTQMLSNDEIVKGNFIADLESYNSMNGYYMKDVGAISMHVSADNILWAGTSENVVRFNFNAVAIDTMLPKVFIQAIRINNEKVIWNTLPSSFDSNKKLQTDSNTTSPVITEEGLLFGRRLDDIQRDSLSKKFEEITFDSITTFYPVPVNPVLPYHQNNITIDFAAIETGRPQLVRYQYILEGYDDEWSPVTDKSTASFGNIHEGHYTFKVKAQSPDGVWSEPLIYNFSVLPPWYRSWWAYALYTCIFLIAISGFIRWRIKGFKKEKLLLEEKVTRRTHELQEEKEKVESTLSELKSTQSQLIQSEKMASLGQLTAGIAHEIQNPLNFVNNFSDINKELLAELKEEADKGNISEVKTIANDIIDNEEKINLHGKRADSIVKGMLQHSRSSSGIKEPTDINALADEYLRLAYHGMRGKDKTFNATMQTDFDNSIGKINIIPQDIGRVLLNLYNNAFYAVNEKKKQQGNAFEPTVSVKTKKIGNKVEIKVVDNGNGIPENIVDKIFQPFYTTKPTGQGTGLGLSLSYDIVKAHGGELKVKSKKDEGSEFVLFLTV